jgi:hypothetical protein
LPFCKQFPNTATRINPYSSHVVTAIFSAIFSQITDAERRQLNPDLEGGRNKDILAAFNKPMHGKIY